MVCIGTLAACGGGVTPVESPASLSTTTGLNLTLSGTPATSVAAGSSYSFQPTVTQGSGTVTFSIAGMPIWATFNSTTGALSGTPSTANEGMTGAITITAGSGGQTASIGPFTIDVTAPTKLVLSGAPATSVAAGSSYAFQPTVTQSSGTVAFSISGMPSWATFDSTTGALTGTPSTANEGMTGAITITASSGGQTASIGPFTIDVTSPTIGGSATLTWVAPTQNSNGTPLTDLAGFIIQYGTSPAAMTQSITVPSASATSYEITNLAPGAYYFQIIAYASDGTQSAPSNVGSLTI